LGKGKKLTRRHSVRVLKNLTELAPGTLLSSAIRPYQKGEKKLMAACSSAAKKGKEKERRRTK